MSKQPEALMKLADVYADASFDQGLHQREVDPAPEIAREALAYIKGAPTDFPCERQAIRDAVKAAISKAEAA